MVSQKTYYSKYLKIGCTSLVVSGIAWVICQIKTTKDILNNAVDLSMLKILEDKTEDVQKMMLINLEPEFIDLNHLSPKKPTILDSFKFKYAQRLIGLCQSDNNFVRIKALLLLGKTKNLDYGHVSLLSTMIDKSTAVSLARVKDVDCRLFKEPPVKYLKYNDKMLINEMKELLLNLSEMSKHACLEYFISKAFFDIEDSSRLIDSETAPVEMAKLGQNDQDLLPVCLESLLHHASIESFGKDIVKLNALPLLSEIHNRFRDNVAVNIALCRIISFLSFHTEVLEELHMTGWIGILAEWMKHENIRISVPAARALANLEKKCVDSYKRHLYLLHPTHVGNSDPKVDVVFVHGLLGGVFFTWRQRIKSDLSVGLLGKSKSSSNMKRKESITETLHNHEETTKNLQNKNSNITMECMDNFENMDLSEVNDFEVVLDDIPITGNCTSHCGYTCKCENLVSDDSNSFTYCWPRDWLAKDCSNLRIIGINYDTTLSKWNSFCPHFTGRTHIEDQSLTLLTNLLLAGVGKRPIVWVTHSMGGLLVKNILCKSFNSTDPKLHQLVENTKGIIFYSTPHYGSNLATFSSASQLALRLSIEVQDLRENSRFLLDIHEKFLKIIETLPIKLVTFVETNKTVFTAFKFNFQLVTPESGNTGAGEYYQIPLDHLGICKPVSKYSFLYRKVLDFIQEIVDNT